MDIDRLEKKRQNHYITFRHPKFQPELPSFGGPVASGLQLLQSGHLSDFTIKCEDIEFRVHKSHIYAHSGYFRSVVDGNFTETQKNSVTLEDTTAGAVGMLLLLMYVGDTGQYLHHVCRAWPAIRALPTHNSPLVPKDDGNYFNNHLLLEFMTLVEAHALADRLFVQHIANISERYISTFFEFFLIDWRQYEYDEDIGSEQEGHDIFGIEDVLEHLYRTVPETSTLRSEITAHCLYSKASLGSMHKVAKLIKVHDPHGWRVGHYLAVRYKQKHDDMVEHERERNARNCASRVSPSVDWVIAVDRDVWGELAEKEL